MQKRIRERIREGTLRIFVALSSRDPSPRLAFLGM